MAQGRNRVYQLGCAGFLAVEGVYIVIKEDMRQMPTLGLPINPEVESDSRFRAELLNSWNQGSCFAYPLSTRVLHHCSGAQVDPIQIMPTQIWTSPGMYIRTSSLVFKIEANDLDIAENRVRPQSQL